MAGRVVLVEGLDLAGKSTLVKNLAGELAGRGVPVRVSRNSLCPDNPIAALADQVRRDPCAGLAETGALFLAAHLWDARHFAPPADGTVHLQDSCWLRTLAYHTFHGTPGIPGLLREAMASFPRFDAAVFLTASIEERQRRLAQRERDQPGSNDEGDHAVVRRPEQFKAVEAELLRLAKETPLACVIDTTDLAVERLLEIGRDLTVGQQRGGRP
jgi:thymidylate kinase